MPRVVLLVPPLCVSSVKLSCMPLQGGVGTTKWWLLVLFCVNGEVSGYWWP